MIQNVSKIAEVICGMMTFSFQNLTAKRTGLVLLLVIIAVGISFLTRVALLIKSFSAIDLSFINLSGAFLVGFFYDLTNAVYVSIPIVVYLWIVPGRIYTKPWHRFKLYALFSLLTFLLLFNAVSEWFFWDEFNTRFNFIAVDYLVYTTEVVGNIQQSYPIGTITTVLSLVSFSFIYWIRDNFKQNNSIPLPFRNRTMLVATYAATLTLVTIFISSKFHRFSDNTFVNELAGNGLYELFAAYRNNELDYEQFYKHIDSRTAFALAHVLLKTPDAKFSSSDQKSLQRKIIHDGGEKKLNVVMISVESFSASFMKTFGNDQNITPFIDSLAQHSLLFTNLYATGTRTVRGLEALSLCIPPTPGQSVVRRPNNENLFSLAKVFDEKGYESQYIYGGYGYFDNMNYFFSSNGYNVTDRSAINDEAIDHENVWGVADENLFELAIHQIDEVAKSKPVFAHIMTTSNHRPYTYPEGRIDIPSHTGRDGAVKYTDYAIGKFIKDAYEKPWFKNTMFVIVADHCASSAGKTELPVDSYHIPMLIYAPSFVAPGRMDRLMSQIDIGPTLLGLLNFSYDTKFYGYDIFNLEPGRERAFVSTYQSLGYIKDGRMVVLSPQQRVECYRLSGNEQVRVEPDQAFVDEAIAWYQAASYSFSNGLMGQL